LTQDRACKGSRRLRSAVQMFLKGIVSRVNLNNFLFEPHDLIFLTVALIVTLLNKGPLFLTNLLHLMAFDV
jgi:hypothetical protein